MINKLNYKVLKQIAMLSCCFTLSLLLVSCSNSVSKENTAQSNYQSTQESTENQTAEQTENTRTTDLQSEETTMPTGDYKVNITANGTTLTAVMYDNSSSRALKEMLENGAITIDMSDYSNFEKVGSLGTALPTNDEQIITEPGDIILYQGINLVIYYDTNNWNFTRLGKIDNATKSGLLEVLGSGNVTVTLSLAE
ncbi:MAG: cyclophilin-like fold protein [Clostridium sp.]|nr:cyclophilin-like fold protein [Clostridium sp.]